MVICYIALKIQQQRNQIHIHFPLEIMKRLEKVLKPAHFRKCFLCKKISPNQRLRHKSRYNMFLKAILRIFERHLMIYKSSEALMANIRFWPS